MRRWLLGAAIVGLLAAALLLACSFALDGYAGAPAEPDAAIDATHPMDATSEEAEARPIVFVQTSADQNLDASTTTFSVAYDDPPADHDTLVVALFLKDGGTLNSVSDDLGNSFQILCNQTIDEYGVTAYLATATDIVGGAADRVTMHITPTSVMNVILHEYANIGSTSGCMHASGSSTAVDGIVSPPLPLSVPNELIFAYAISGTVGAGTGFTARSHFHDDLTEDRIVAMPTPTPALATVVEDGPSWGIVAAAFAPR